MTLENKENIKTTLEIKCPKCFGKGQFKLSSGDIMDCKKCKGWGSIFKKI